MKWTKYQFSAEEVIAGLYSTFVNKVQTLYATPMNAEKGLIVGYSEPEYTVVLIRENDGTFGFDTFTRKWKKNLVATGIALPIDKLDKLSLLVGQQDELKEIKSSLKGA